jgi:hypothetical protein
MSKIIAYADLFRDWEGVSGARAQNAALLPKSEALRPDLDTVLAQARALKLQQENLMGNSQAMTQSLVQLVATGTELARKLRNQIKVELGSKSEHLVQFGIAPLRKHVRKAKVVKPPAAATPEPPAGPRHPQAGRLGTSPHPYRGRAARRVSGCFTPAEPGCPH